MLFFTAYPYELAVWELLLRSVIAASVFVLVSIATWSRMHRFIFSGSWRDFILGLLFTLIAIFEGVVLVPLSRLHTLQTYLLVSIPLIAALLALNRSFIRKFGTIQEKNKLKFKKIALFLGIAVILITGLFAGAEIYFISSSRELLSLRIEAVQNNLSARQASSAAQISALAEDPQFVDLFKEGDYSGLNLLTKQLLEQTELDALAITDSYGFTLVAPHNPRLVGQNLGALGPEHLAVLKGEERRMIEPAITAPMVMVAGVPIKEGDIQTGALFAGNLITDDLVRRIAQESRVTDLGIYYPDNKLSVTTIEDGETNKALNNWISVYATDSNLGGNDTFTQILKIKDTSYTAVGYILKQEGKEAVIAVYEPYLSGAQKSFYRVMAGTAALAAILIFFSPYIIHRIIL